MRKTLPHLAVLLALMGLVVASACERADPASLEADEALFAMHGGGDHEADLTPEVRQQLAALRELTAPYHDLEAGMEAGYGTPVTECLSHPTEGAMGVHYGNLDLFDATVELLAPETILYEPQKNGKMRLVGVEYIVPFAAHPATEDPPELMGQHFHANEEAGVWGFHVWLWRHNPSGLFADWNPKVTCRWAG